MKKALHISAVVGILIAAAVALAGEFTYVLIAIRNDHKENPAIRNALLTKIRNAYADTWTAAEIAQSWREMTNETENVAYWVFIDSDKNVFGSRRFGGAFNLETKLDELNENAPEGIYFRLTTRPRQTLTDLGITDLPSEDE